MVRSDRCSTTGTPVVSGTNRMTMTTRTCLNWTAAAGVMFTMSAAMAQTGDGTRPDTTTNWNIGPGSLPEIGLVTFEAGSEDGDVVLTWTTATEHDVLAYLVERSEDAATFEVVGEVGSAGNSTSLLQHEFRDGSAHTGSLFYRLRVVRGSFPPTVSLVLSVEHVRPLESMGVHPCPAGPELFVQLPREVENARFMIMDGQGRCLRQGGMAGTHDRLVVEGMPAGTYTLLVHDARGNWLFRTPWMKS